jgi:cytochrome c-type biogenesis protein CcmF
VAAVVATCGALLFGVRDALPLAYVGLSVFAGGVNLLMIVRTLRGGWLRIGGYMAHVGLCVMLIGVVGSSVYASPDERLAFTSGDVVSFQDYDITFNGWQQTAEGGGVIDLTVHRGDEVFSAQPELYFDPDMGSTIQNPHITSYLLQDLYIAPADYVPEFDPARPVVGLGDEVEIGPYTVRFDKFDIDMQGMMEGGQANVGAVLNVLYEGEETTLTPRLQLVEAEGTEGGAHFEYQPVELPGDGNQSLSLASLYPDQQLIILQAEGEGLDNLPVQPEKAVITVSTKPLVLLVWIGLLVLMIGGFIATFRRYLEVEARLKGQPAHLPRGLGLAGLPGKLRWRGSGASR